MNKYWNEDNVLMLNVYDNGDVPYATLTQTEPGYWEWISDVTGQSGDFMDGETLEEMQQVIEDEIQNHLLEEIDYCNAILKVWRET